MTTSAPGDKIRFACFLHRAKTELLMMDKGGKETRASMIKDVRGLRDYMDLAWASLGLSELEYAEWERSMAAGCMSTQELTNDH